jgi:hypothetical protein
MKPYTVMLTDEQIERIRRMAETVMKPEDQFVRDIIDRYTVESGFERYFAMDGAGRGPGGSIADVPEEELMKGFGE